jgi:hypothetical protein
MGSGLRSVVLNLRRREKTGLCLGLLARNTKKIT